MEDGAAVASRSRFSSPANPAHSKLLNQDDGLVVVVWREGGASSWFASLDAAAAEKPPRCLSTENKPCM